MKTTRQRQLVNPKCEIRNPKSPDRQGSVLIVVIGLLLLLMLIGFAFFTFANQEHSNAEIYADSSKSFSVTPNTDGLFNFALEQLIIGPRNSNYQSVLWPGKHSLLPNMLGLFAANPNDTYNANGIPTIIYPTVPTDKHPYNGGIGINIINGTLGQPQLDQNFNGIDDFTDFQNGIITQDNTYLRTLNFSGAAQLTAMGTTQAGKNAGSPTLARTAIYNNFPALDVGYTYADINNAFLAYIGTEPTTGNMVVTPSFHRPLILRDVNGLPFTNANGQPYTGWQYNNTQTSYDTTTSVLRPHPSHLALNADGTASTYPRYILPVNPNPAVALNASNVQIGAFPFLVDTNNNGIYGEQGMWTTPTGVSTPPVLEFDTDNDGDGKREGIWLDLNYPMSFLSDGRKMVPLFSFTVLDGDGLINLTTAGNMAWLSSTGPGFTGLSRPFYGAQPGYPANPGSPEPISHSNLGMSSPAEINPFWALVADPRSTTYLNSPNTVAYGPALALQQYRGFFGLSNTNSSAVTGYNMDRVEAANMDMLRMFWGCPNYNVTLNNGNEVFTINNAIAGRWGDVASLLNALPTGTPGQSPPLLYNQTTGLPLFPRPGVPLFDDDGDLFAGLTDAGYVYTNTNLGYNNVALGGDPTTFQLPLFGNGHVLQSFTGPITNAFTLFPPMVSANPGFNSPVTVLPFGQPLDYTGGGTWTTFPGGGNGLRPNLAQPNLSLPGMYLYYNGYQGSLFSQGASSSSISPYQMAFSGNTAYFTALQLAMTAGSGGVLPYLYSANLNAPFAGPLTANSNTNGVVDEPDETISIGAYAQSSDAIFTLDDTAALQLSQNDYAAAVGQSRVRQLLSFNFEQNLQAAAIRQRFTTASFDRVNHSFGAAINPSPIGNANPANNYLPINPSGNRGWEYYDLQTVGANVVNINNWDGSGQPQFPPMVFGTSMDNLVPATANNLLSGTQVMAEPIRMELAALIGAKLNNNAFNGTLSTAGVTGWYGSAPYEFRGESSSTHYSVSPWQQQQKLNINRFLTAADPNYGFGHSLQQNQQNPLRFRELTPHPTMAAWGSSYNSIGGTLVAQGFPVNSNFPNAANPPFPSASSPSFPNAPNNGQSFAANPSLQEYWARRDRQQMARDIYVLLYLLGGGQDAVNYAKTSNAPGVNGRPVYQDWQLAEMAQFAINVVDSLDRDDTISMFEYDKDLSDGWNLDDDPTTVELTGAFPSGLLDRGIVFGVEAQQLAFNEALVVVSRKVTSGGNPYDHPATQFDDKAWDRTFTYLELYNVSPYGVPLNNGNWQIVNLDPGILYPYLPLTPQQTQPGTTTTQTVPSSNSGIALSALTLADGVFGTIPAQGGQPGVVQPSQPYTIGSRSYIPGTDDQGGTPLASTFNVDPNWVSGAPNLVQMVPAAGATLGLDLVSSTNGTPNANGVYSRYTLTKADYSPLAGNGVLSAIGQFCDMTYGATTPGNATLSTAYNSTVPAYVTTFALRRRLNLNRPAPPIGTAQYNANDEQDNPFIEVDRISYRNYDNSGTDGTSAIAPPTTAPQYGTFFQLRDPGIMTTPSVTDIQPQLMRLVSKERRQPLDGYEAGAASNNTVAMTYTSLIPPWPSTAPVFTSNTGFPMSRVGYYQNQNQYGNVVTRTTYSENTIGGPPNSIFAPPDNVLLPNTTTNANNATVFPLWQPHFDRDFASVGELLSVPLYGPSFVTQSLAPKDSNSSTLNSLAVEAPLAPTATGYYQPLAAQAKIFRPQHPLNVGSPTIPQYDNRWYRVLELLDVPSRANQQIENNLQSQYPWLFPQALQRVPGKMNINQIRYGENLFALLDDPGQFNVFGYNAGIGNVNNPGNGWYTDNYDANRNWWTELLKARDGKDPTATNAYNNANGTSVSLYMPGSPASRPFRPMSYFDNSNAGTNNYNSIDDTLLRATPLDSTLGLNQRRLFEARSQTDLTATGNTIDYYTRQRLLSKIAGNTTQRSNVFLVWVSVGFFEAYQPDPNNPAVVQIGAEMTDQARRRGFFVVDRSMLEDAWVPDFTNPANGYFDYSKFIQYRKTLQ